MQDPHGRRRLLYAALALLLSGIAAGCRTGGHAAQGYLPLGDNQAAQAVQVAQQFWRAQAASDSATARQLSAGPAPQEWANRWRTAYPAFFDSTQSQIAYRHGYFLRSVRDTAIVEVEVPWVTCRPPAHEGKADRYFLKLIPYEATWRITNVWSEPC